MKYILFFIFTINSYAEVCNLNTNLSPELDPMIEELTIKDCFKKSSFEKICKCNKKNEKYNLEKMQPEFDQAKEKIKLETAKNIIDQAKKSFFQIAQNMIILDSTSSLTEVGKSCNINQFDKIKCNNESVLNLLNKDEKNFLDNFKGKIQKTFLSIYEPYSNNNIGLVDRMKFASENSCNMTDKEVYSLNSQKVQSDLIKLIKKNNLLSENSEPTILKTIIKNIEFLNENNKSVVLDEGILNKFLRDPILKELLNSSSTILNNDFSTENIEKILRSQDIENKVAEKQIKDCQNIYKNLESFLCSSPDSIGTSEDNFKNNLKDSIPLDSNMMPYSKDSNEYLNFQIETSQKITYACNNDQVFNKADEKYIASFNENIPENSKKDSSTDFIFQTYEETSVKPRTEICSELLKDEGLVTGKIINIYADYKSNDKNVIQAKTKKNNLLSLPTQEFGPNLNQFLGFEGSNESNIALSPTQEDNSTASGNADNQTASGNSSGEMVSSEKRKLASSTRSKKTKISGYENNQVGNQEEDRGMSVADMKYQSQTSSSHRYGNYQEEKSSEADVNAMSDIIKQMKSRRKRLKEDINKVATSKDIDRKKMIDEYRELTKENKALTNEYKRLKEEEEDTPVRKVASTNNENDEVSGNSDFNSTASGTSKLDSPTSTPANGRKIASSKSGRNESRKGYYNNRGEFIKDSGIEVTSQKNNFGIGIVGDEVKEVVLDPGLEEFKLEDIEKAFQNRKSKKDILNFIDIIEKEDAFIISQFNNKDHKVLIKKEGDSFRIIQKGDLSDPEFKDFYQNVVKAFNAKIFEKLKVNSRLSY